MGKVLIIDDDPTYSAMLARQVAKLGHEANVAGSLKDGLEASATFQPDVVFLDVDLPDGNGLSAVGRIKEQPNEPEVVVVTGRGSTDGAEVAVRSGAWDYICKGDTFHRIVLALNRSMEYREQKKAAAPRVLDPCGILGRSPAMRGCFEAIAQASENDAGVLVTGETGTGKELCAWAIHSNSRRSKKNFIVVDCAALPENLVESMLFGHRKGAFTGAAENSVGMIEQADGGTLFLDEVAEMPLTLQKAFLRVLQEKRFRPVGGEKEVHSDFRLVAATNRNLDRMVQEGSFRADLLFRLRSLAVHSPPLRERGEDVQAIAKEFVARICERDGLDSKWISPEFRETLAPYPWPGNVRELLGAVEHAMAAATYHHTLYPTHLPTEIRVYAAQSGVPAAKMEPDSPLASKEMAEPGRLPPFQQYRDEATRKYLKQLMADGAGNVAEACRISGISRTYLYTLLKEHGFQRK